MSSPGRWTTYVMESGGSLDELLRDHLGSAERDVCVILGSGFDPRMNMGLRRLLAAGGEGRRSVVLLEYDEGPTSPSHEYSQWVGENAREIEDLRDQGAISSIGRRTVQMFSVDGRRIGARSAAQVFGTMEEVGEYTDVFVDVSSFPRSIFFPLLAKLIHLHDRCDSSSRRNLFVLATESPLVDEHIVDEGVDESADYIHPFRSGAERMAAAGEPTIWIPILGESQLVQLERLYELVDPNEICPILPSPSLNPRRGDNLVIEYRELLFDRLRIEPRNILYASERNPFEVYRQIRRTILHYQNALQPLGGCQPVVSSVSTKLLSLGALLAAYELRQAGTHVGIAHIECQGYRVGDMEAVRSMAHDSTLFGLWIAGECYA